MSATDELKDVIRRIRKIEITTRALTDGSQAGLHSSLVRAHGIEFSSLREYVPGDDIRAIDWKVTARKNHPYVREFTEDREQTFYIVVDRSGSSTFGSETSKDDRITWEIEVGAAGEYDLFPPAAVFDHPELQGPVDVIVGIRRCLYVDLACHPFGD